MLVEVSSDVQLVVCMVECMKIFRIRFAGATDFFNIIIQQFYFVFAAAALLGKVNLVML